MQLKMNFWVTLLTFLKTLFCKAMFIVWQRRKSKHCSYYISVSYVFYPENLIIRYIKWYVDSLYQQSHSHKAKFTLIYHGTIVWIYIMEL